MPDPDYSDFFQTAQNLGWMNKTKWLQKICLPFEGSWGCWWGVKRQCRFCGVAGMVKAYRKKPADRVFDTINANLNRYRIPRMLAADSAMNPSFFKSLIPRLAQSGLKDRIKLFFQVKADMTRAKVKVMFSFYRKVFGKTVC